MQDTVCKRLTTDGTDGTDKRKNLIAFPIGVIRTTIDQNLRGPRKILSHGIARNYTEKDQSEKSLTAFFP